MPLVPFITRTKPYISFIIFYKSIMTMEVCLRIIAVTLILFLCFLTIHLNLCTAESDVCCFESERHALLSFKKDVEDPSNRLTSWAATADVDCCQWVGVVCHNVTGHVLLLHLKTLLPWVCLFRPP